MELKRVEEWIAGLPPRTALAVRAWFVFVGCLYTVNGAMPKVGRSTPLFVAFYGAGDN